VDNIPPSAFYRKSKRFRQIITYYFQKQLVEAGTLKNLTHARELWKRAKLEAWSTMSEAEREAAIYEDVFGESDIEYFKRRCKELGISDRPPVIR
jgi:hypothetical protein